MRAVIAIICFMVSAQAFAYDAKTLKALNGVQSELSYCAGYYTIVKHCVGDQDAKLAKDTERTEHLVMERAVKLGLDIGMSNEAILARVEVHQKELQKPMLHNCANISPLQKRFGKRCIDVILHQDAILKEYMAPSRK